MSLCQQNPLLITIQFKKERYSLNFNMIHHSLPLGIKQGPIRTELFQLEKFLEKKQTCINTSTIYQLLKTYTGEGRNKVYLQTLCHFDNTRKIA